MSIADKLNTWFDQFIKVEDNANKIEEEQWTLRSINSLAELFDNVYGDIPNKPATSKIHTFITIMVNALRAAPNARRHSILTKFYQLKSCFNTILTENKPGEYYLTYLPHNLKVFYVDIISVLMKFPEFKPILKAKVEAAAIIESQTASDDFIDDIVMHPLHEQLDKLLSAIPINTEQDKKLLLTKEILTSFVKHKVPSIELLTAVLDELLTEKYEFLRRDKNLLRTLTGTFARNQTWVSILNEIKQKALDIVKAQISNHENISDETWLLTESIINERAFGATLFKDHYTDELEAVHRKYIMQVNAEQVI